MNYIKQNLLLILMITVILSFTAIRFAEPICDSDYFFHIAYGKYFVENRTIIPDHSIYSWTPTVDNDYCSWLPEIFFYLLHKYTGYKGICALRYICVLFSLILIFLYAGRMGREKNPLTFLYMAVFITGSYVGTLHKPEMLSFAFINLLVFLYFYIKLDFQEGKKEYWMFYYIPVIILLWANTHGVFFFGIVFLLSVSLGESLNYLLYYLNKNRSSDDKWNDGALFRTKHFFVSLILSFIAVFMTPYHYPYIVKLFSRPFDNKRTADWSQTMAYGSPFKDIPPEYHMTEIFIFMSAIILFTILYGIIKKKKIDFAVIIINLVFCYGFTKFLRTTYLWCPVFTYSALYLQKNFSWLKERKKLQVIFNSFILIYFMFFSGRAIYDCFNRPFMYSWTGFGVGYQNPVAESEYMKKYKPGTVLFNDYDVGAYLMWDLYPEYKVAIDARAFPYVKWFPEYVDFIKGKTFETFINKYNFDVAMIGIRYEKCIFNFLLSPYWKPAYFGPTAVIFVKHNIPVSEEGKNFMPERFYDIKEINKLGEVVLFFIRLKEFDKALEILDRSKDNFRTSRQKKIVDSLYIYREANVSYYVDNDYEKALYLYEKSKDYGTILNDPALNRIYRWKSLVFASEKKYKKAFEYEKKIMDNYPYDSSAFYNGAILLYLQKEKDEQWKSYLESFVIREPNHFMREDIMKLLNGENIEIKLITYPGQPVFPVKKP